MLSPPLGLTALRIALPVVASWMWPDLVRVEPGAFWIIVAAFAVPTAYAFIKYGTLGGRPTRAALAAVVAVAGAVLLVALGGPSIALRVAALVAMVAAVEDIVVTTIQPIADVSSRSLRALLRARSSSR